MLVKRWFEDTFPGTTVESMNGAIGGSDSSYYAFCGVSACAGLFARRGAARFKRLRLKRAQS